MLRVQLRRGVIAGVALAVLAGAGCSDRNNTVTGPMPMVTATRTPAPGPAAPTPTPAPAGNRVVNVGQGGGNAFMDQQSGTATTTISMGTTVEWVWVSGFHSTTSGACGGTCTPNGLWNSGAGSGMTFSRTFNQVGTFPYFCSVHGAMMTGTVVVQ